MSASGPTPTPGRFDAWKQEPPVKASSPWRLRLLIGVPLALALVASTVFTWWLVSGVKEHRARDLQLGGAMPRLGDCLRDPITFERDYFNGLPVVPCRLNHFGEVFAEFEVQELSRDDPDLERKVWETCTDAFTTFVGVVPSGSELEWWYWAPNDEGIAMGDRTVQCVVEAPEAYTGTLEGSRR